MSARMGEVMGMCPGCTRKAHAAAAAALDDVPSAPVMGDEEAGHG